MELKHLAVGKVILLQSVLARRRRIGCPCMKLNQIDLQCRWIELQILILQKQRYGMLKSLSEIRNFKKAFHWTLANIQLTDLQKENLLC